MKVTPLILATTLLLGAAAIGYGKPAQSADKHWPTNATAMKAGTQRHTHLVAIKAWRKTTGELQAAAGPAQPWEDVEEVFFTDGAADGAASKALPVNQRWWKFTDACQLPLPAAAKGEIWDGMTEIYHLD